MCMWPWLLQSLQACMCPVTMCLPFQGYNAKLTNTTTQIRQGWGHPVGMQVNISGPCHVMVNVAVIHRAPAVLHAYADLKTASARVPVHSLLWVTTQGSPIRIERVAPFPAAHVRTHMTACSPPCLVCKLLHSCLDYRVATPVQPRPRSSLSSALLVESS